MKVNDASEILNAKLLSAPLITKFSNITTNVDKVLQGSLFISKDVADIKIAIDNGAYGILSEYDMDSIILFFSSRIDEPSLIDLRDKLQESAYYHTNSLSESVIRLLRYEILSKHTSLVYFSSVEYEIAKAITTNDKDDVLFFDGELIYLIDIVANKTCKNIFVRNKDILAISLDSISSVIPEIAPFQLVSANLFDMKIFFKSKNYEINLPKLFLDELASVINMLESEGVEFDLDRFSQISHLKPNFITPLGYIGKYGTSERVVIAEENIADFKRYMSYIATYATWGKMLFLMPEPYIEVFGNVARALSYANSDELIKYIKRENYNFALVFGVNDDFIIQNLTLKIQETSLFPDL